MKYDCVQTSGQRGAVLVIVLVMVGIFMVIVTSLVASSSINFRIAGNQQYRMEAKVAAKNAIELYISNIANFETPLPATPDDIAFDFSGDGTPDLTAFVQPATCTGFERIQLSELSYGSVDDVKCFGGDPNDNSGLIGGGTSATGGSQCARINWRVEANISDEATGAELDMIQGLFIRAKLGTPCPT